MNKALNILVFVILALAIAALVFEITLFGKRELLKERNQQLEDSIVRLAKTIESEDPTAVEDAPTVMKDVSAVENRVLDNPEKENLLEGYPAALEQQNLPSLNLENKRVQLRQYYFLGPDGKTVPDVNRYNKPKITGKDTADELLSLTFERAKAQQAALNKTRGELTSMRELLARTIEELNALKIDARAAKATITELEAKVTDLESKITTLTEEVAQKNQQIEDLNAEIASQREARARAENDLALAKEDMTKLNERYEDLKKKFAERGRHGKQEASITSMTAGDKGALVEVNNRLMFAIIEFSDAAMVELLGSERDGVLPLLSLNIRRPGLQSAAGEFVGRVKLRQAIAGKNLVVADLLGDWQQVPAEKNDVVFF